MSDETPKVEQQAPPTPPAQPSKQATQVDDDLNLIQPPEGWQPGQWSALVRQRRKAAEYRTETEQLKARLAELEPKLGEVDTWRQKAEQAEQRLTSQERKFQQDLVMRDIGGNFKHASVQSLARRMYAEHVEGVEEPPAFGEWLTSEAVKADPVLGVHFPKQEEAFEEPDFGQAPPASQRMVNLVDPQTGAVIGQAPAPAAIHTGGGPQRTGKAQWTNDVINRLRAQGKWQAGRIDRATGKPIGGSAAWRQYMTDLG